MRRCDRLVAVIGFTLLVSPSQAYTLLGFPSDTLVNSGWASRWATETPDPPSISLSYSYDAAAFSRIPGATAAIDRAFTKWDQANSVISLNRATYAPVLNTDDNLPAEGDFEGPANFGLGANIDVFMVPAGWTHSFLGQDFSFDSNALATTFVQKWSQYGTINTVDIYLNAKWNWRTDGGDFDVESVVLHEIGHSLGLDHTDQAAANGAKNYDPYTHKAGQPWTAGDLMNSGYYPDGVNRTIGADEIGGLAFLYPGLEGDADLDKSFTFFDIQLAIDMFMGFTDPPNPEALRNIDLDKNGMLDFMDLDGLITRFMFPDGNLAPPGYTLSFLRDAGYDVSRLPEPSTGSCLFVFLAWRVFRRRVQ
jgi:hypothetical protein